MSRYRLFLILAVLTERRGMLGFTVAASGKSGRRREPAAVGAASAIKSPLASAFAVRGLVGLRQEVLRLRISQRANPGTSSFRTYGIRTSRVTVFPMRW